MKTPTDSHASSSVSVETDLHDVEGDGDGPASGELTPAICNRSFPKRLSVTQAMGDQVPASPLSFQQQEHEVSSRAAEDDDEESSLGDSWEPIEPDMQEESEQVGLEPSGTPAPAVYTTMKPPPEILYRAQPAVFSTTATTSPQVIKPSTKKSPKLFLVLFCVALLFGVLGAAGILDQYKYLQQQQQQHKPHTTTTAVKRRRQTFANSTVTRTVHTPPATTSTTKQLNNKQEKEQTVKPKNEYPNTSNKFLWLSLDDDVLAGQVFWGNETPNPPQQEQLSPPPPPPTSLFGKNPRTFLSKDVATTTKEVREDRQQECSRSLQHTSTPPLPPSTLILHQDTILMDLDEQEEEVEKEKEELMDWSEQSERHENQTKLTNLHTSFPTKQHWNQKLELIHSIVELYDDQQQQQRQKQPPRIQKGPLNWIARHYQRLNVYVLGQSQLAQLKRRQNLIW